MGAGHQWPAAPGRRLPGTRARGAFPPAGDDGKRGGCGDGVMHGPAAERATSRGGGLPGSDKTGTSHHQAGPVTGSSPPSPALTRWQCMGRARPAYMSPLLHVCPAFLTPTQVPNPNY